MSTTTPIPMPDSSRELFPASASLLDEQLEHEDEDTHPGQNRSSSLSDIEDRADEDIARSERDLPANDSDSNDTEAETERLEDSPQKLLRNQNFVMTAANSAHSISPMPYEPVENQSRERIGHGSDAASLRDSSLEGDSAMSISRSPRKRKRSADNDDELDSQPSTKRLISNTSISANPSASKRLEHSQHSIQANGRGDNIEASDREEQKSEEEAQNVHAPVRLKSKPDKRRTGKARDSEARLRSPSELSVNGNSEPMGNAEAADSNGEDGEADDPGEHAEFESTAKDEEVVVNRKSAMDSLTAIEKCFAKLRDKLYDERLAKCDAELAMLERPDIRHPELLSMKEVLEQRRDEKIQLESTLLKYKLGSLQNKSIAEKAQMHGQYMQTVRDVRDRNLEQVNKEWYQIHKERRSREDDVPEYMYLFPLRRSQQITNQTAYNKEVSLLSGLAKYRGFPAAPEIHGAKPGEIDSDLEKLGIVQQPVAPLARHPPSLRASFSANTVLPRPEAVADEHFLEQNPWANPQHPAHLHRQASALSRTVSPLATPAAQRRPPDLTGGARPASTLVEGQQGAYPAMHPLPVTVQPDKDPKATRLGFSTGTEHGPHLSTFSRLPPIPVEKSIPISGNHPSALQKSNASTTTSSEKAHPSTNRRVQAPEIHMKAYVPKIPRRMDSPSSAPPSKYPTSPPGRFPVIKAEDITRLPGRSPTPQHYHCSVPVNVTANGASDR